jgi:hypothetical protein
MTTATLEREAILMFREVVTSADGSTDEGSCTEEHVTSVLATAVRRGYRIEATRKGGMIVTRDVYSGRSIVPLKHTVTLEPSAEAVAITAATRKDLAMIDRRTSAGLPSWLADGRIRAGYFFSVPAAAAARLMRGGLITVTDGTVAVSLAARLAMCAQDHPATASKPRGYYHDPDHFGPWRKGSCMHDRSSVASCPCRWSKSAGDVDDARRFAREHRQEVTAAMVRELLAGA